MSSQHQGALPPEQEHVLTTELAQVVLEQAAPEELLIFDETAAEYFQDPDRMLKAGSREEPVGFGLEMELLTPYVLAVVAPVVTFLISVVSDSIREASKTAVGEWVRGLFKAKAKTSTADAASVPALTAEQARRIHEIAHQRATALGLPEATAVLLADSVVGGVQVSS